MLGLGIVVAARGGLMNDFHAHASVRTELRNVVEGNVRPGLPPGTRFSTPEIRRKSRELDQQREVLERRLDGGASAVAGGRPRPARCCLIALFLLVAQWKLYPAELPGQINANRSVGCSILMGLAGLRMLTAQPGRTACGSHRPWRRWPGFA